MRHAQSDANVGNMYKDSNITEFGVQQASKIAGNFDLAICSPLKRTQQTLKSSKIVYNNIIISNNCREYLDGNICNVLDHETKYAETLGEFLIRIHNFKVQIKSYLNLPNPPNSILIVSHGSFMYHFMNHKKEIANCEIFDISKMFK